MARRCRALGGENGSDTGIGRRVLGAAIGPGLEVLEGIDDAAADLAICRTRLRWGSLPPSRARDIAIEQVISAHTRTEEALARHRILN